MFAGSCLGAMKNISASLFSNYMDIIYDSANKRQREGGR